MGFQSTALIYSSIPEGEIKRIDRPSALWCHSSPQLYVKLKTQLKFKLFQSEAAPQPMFHLIELWWKSDARFQSQRQMGTVGQKRYPSPWITPKHFEKVMSKDRPAPSQALAYIHWIEFTFSSCIVGKCALQSAEKHFPYTAKDNSIGQMIVHFVISSCDAVSCYPFRSKIWGRLTKHCVLSKLLNYRSVSFE